MARSKLTSSKLLFRTSSDRSTEKPTVAEGVVSGGFFVFNRRVFDYLGDDPKTFLELEPLQRLARDGELSVFVHEGFWHPMDTYRDWLHLDELWKAGRAPWKAWE